MDRVRELVVLPELAAEIAPLPTIMDRVTLDDAGRFRNAHQVESYLGLVPRGYRSGEKQNRGRITFDANPGGEPHRPLLLT